MANIKFGNGWADARGKVGGVIYSKNKGGSYAKNYTKPANPRTPAQVAQRNRFSFVSTNWRELDNEERNAWNYAASQTTVSNKIGEKIHLTGAQYFGKQNLAIFSAGGTSIVKTPSQLVDIIGAVALEVVANVVAGVVTDLKVSAVLVDGTKVVPANHRAQIMATPELSNGITRPQPSSYRYLVGLPPAASLTDSDITVAYTNNFPMPTPGANVWVKVNMVNDLTGQKSQELEVKVVYVTTP